MAPDYIEHLSKHVSEDKRERWHREASERMKGCKAIRFSEHPKKSMLVIEGWKIVPKHYPEPYWGDEEDAR